MRLDYRDDLFSCVFNLHFPCSLTRWADPHLGLAVTKMNLIFQYFTKSFAQWTLAHTLSFSTIVLFRSIISANVHIEWGI